MCNRIPEVPQDGFQQCETGLLCEVWSVKSSMSDDSLPRTGNSGVNGAAGPAGPMSTTAPEFCRNYHQLCGNRLAHKCGCARRRCPQATVRSGQITKLATSISVSEDRNQKNAPLTRRDWSSVSNQPPNAAKPQSNKGGSRKSAHGAHVSRLKPQNGMARDGPVTRASGSCSAIGCGRDARVRGRAPDAIAARPLRTGGLLRRRWPASGAVMSFAGSH